MSKKITGALLCAAFLFSPAACFADEETSSTVEVSVPGATSSTSVSKKSDATGSSTAVKKTKSTAGGSRSTTFKAKAGPGGAKISKTKKNVDLNLDGSVSASKSHESHAVNAKGSVHKKSDTSETVDLDGSTSKVKVESTTAN